MNELQQVAAKSIMKVEDESPWDMTRERIAMDVLERGYSLEMANTVANKAFGVDE